jgi:hypothetical protein
MNDNRKRRRFIGSLLVMAMMLTIASTAFACDGVQQFSAPCGAAYSQQFIAPPVQQFVQPQAVYQQQTAAVMAYQPMAYQTTTLAVAQPAVYQQNAVVLRQKHAAVVQPVIVRQRTPILARRAIRSQAVVAVPY